MTLLKDKDRDQITQVFNQKLTGKVKLVYFTQELECETCALTGQLLGEVAALSDKIELVTRNFVLDKDDADKYKVDKIPALVILGEGDKDWGIRFFGIPAGYEFTALIEDIIDVSAGTHNLPQAIVDELAKIDKPVNIQALVSPNCPYCPKAVRTAHRFAMANPNIMGSMVEVSEFPWLAQKYNVQGVPTSIVNETGSVVGAVPETEVLKKVLEVLGE